MDKKITAFLIKFSDNLLGEICGCDIQVLSPLATAEDMLQALDDFAAEYLADCRGCDGCCRERAPLTCLDMDKLIPLVEESPWPIHSVCKAYANLDISKAGVTDITWKRGEDNACLNLDQINKQCKIWANRAFVCRSHFCLPRSQRLSQLREELVNAGENELTRLLLLEEESGAPPLNGRPLAEQVNPQDYASGPLMGCRSASQVYLQKVLSPELWQELQNPPEL